MLSILLLLSFFNVLTMYQVQYIKSPKKPMLSKTGRQRSRSSTEYKKQQKLINDIYQCIRDRDYFKKRSSTQTNPLNTYCSMLYRNKVLCNQKLQLLGKDIQLDKYPINSFIRNIKFRTYINYGNIDWYKKQNNQGKIGGYHMLGLDVKKINYCRKEKKYGEKKMGEGNQSCLYSSFRSQSLNNQTRKKQQNKSIQLIKMHTNDKYHLCKTSFGRKKYEPRMPINPQYQNTIYQNRIHNYKQFIFKVNMIYNVYVEIEKDEKDDGWSFKNQMKFKAWIGGGNNQHLVRELIKRRFWWTIVEEKSMSVNFIWTQLKVNEYFSIQPSSKRCIFSSSPTKLYKQTKIPQPGNPSRKPSRSHKQYKKSLQQQNLYKIFTEQQIKRYTRWEKKLVNRSYDEKKQYLKLVEIKNNQCRMHNHLINNFYLGNKKAMFYNLKEYYQLIGENIFNKLPLTFHIRNGVKDHQYAKFLQYYKQRQLQIKTQQKLYHHQGGSISPIKKLRNIWIVKPGELTNRGNGITVIEDISELNQIIKRENYHDDGTEKTFIVQLYIDRPLLYNKRKFDIRHYMLITHVHGIMRGFWYKEGYIRTSSYEFDIDNFEREIHLTNDAVQKQTEFYGRYEPGNKISYAQFQKYLDVNYLSKSYNFAEQILPQMKKMAQDAIKSSYLKLSPQRLQHNFQLFGLDFMIDQDFNLWLIEINTNPCLQLSSPLLARIIPRVVDQALRLSLDIVFPPPCSYPNTQKHLVPQTSLEYFNYQLIFDEKILGGEIEMMYKKSDQRALLEDIGRVDEEGVYEEGDDDDGEEYYIDELL